MSNKYFITTPIYYVNGKPHLGHIYTTLAADVFSRFNRLDGMEVFFMTGTDEHGQKVAKSALDQGLTPIELCNRISEVFEEASKQMQFSYDYFMRTTYDFHKEMVIGIWNKLLQKGYIYLDKYCGWYALRDECYYQESELVDGKAPTGAEVTWLEEESYFFKLSAFSEKLLDYFEKNPDFIKPEHAKNEIISFIKMGLNDISVSRTTFDWGIAVPKTADQSQNHVMYVWLDALFNYYTAPMHLKKPQMWPADLQIVGKDILRFHAIYWPAFLMTAELEIPKRIFAHGWWLVEGDKMSKSLGNVLDPLELAKQYSVDYVRYFLMREMQFGKDHSFSHENFVSRCNSELANTVGNLLQRVVSFVVKFAEGRVPKANLEKHDLNILNECYDALAKVRHMIQQQELNSAYDLVIHLAKSANEYIDKEAPWNLKKTDISRMNTVLYTLLEMLRVIAILLQPLIPTSAARMLDSLGVPESERVFKNLTSAFALKEGDAVSISEIIFPRIV